MFLWLGLDAGRSDHARVHPLELALSLPAASACVAAGIANVDTRAITMRLRDTGCLNGVICDDLSVPVEELVSRCKSWTIVGKDLIKEARTRSSISASACFRV